jgi:alkanesulfonate monooxygenase SsuD/methylene tetrahydromethanopterin reductase-like flavin-dependent oxidoreductase (luciferase family)
VAGLTKRIRLGTGAAIMPWNDPYRVAAKMALLDQQSGGRALMGFGRGLSRREYESFGIPMDEARPRFDEGTRLVADALESGVYEASTPYFQQKRCALRPRPTGSFEDRLFAIGVSPDSAVQAAVLGARLMVLAQQPWEVFREKALRPYQERWHELYDSPPPAPLLGQLVYCDDDSASAHAKGEEYVKNYFMTVVEHYEIAGQHFAGTKGYEYYGDAARAIEAMGLEAMASMYASVNTFGTPDEIVEQIEHQREILGCEVDVLMMVKYGGMTQAECEGSMARIAAGVLPKLRDSKGRTAA